MWKRISLLIMALSGLLMGEAEAVLSPDHVDEEKSAAPYQLIFQVDAVELLETNATGGLDRGRATGRIIDVLRSPKVTDTVVLRRGDSVSFRVPIWAWSDRHREPPGPDRLYWGPGAPAELLEVWGAIDEGEFVASVFASKDVEPRAGQGASVAQALDRIDEIEAAFVEASGAPDRDLAGSLERIAGLRLLPTASGATERRAEPPAEDGWAFAARLRLAGNSRILTISLGDATCVRRGDVTGRRGPDARPIPVPPHRKLPAPWHLEYVRPWGRIVFAFRMVEPHDYDDCLVEVLSRQDR